MKNISKYLLPIIFFGVIGVMVLSVVLVISGIRSYIIELPKYDYTINDVFISDVMSVIGVENDSIIKPFIAEDVSILRYYYDETSDEKRQESSIIYYENSYIQNKGVDYSSLNEFDIVSILDGEVISIEDNLIYGKVLTIRHNDNLVSVYSNIQNVLVSVGNTVSQGEIIGTSSISKIDSDNINLLHFEVIYKNENIDPETIYTLNVSSLQ